MEGRMEKRNGGKGRRRAGWREDKRRKGMGERQKESGIEGRTEERNGGERQK